MTRTLAQTCTMQLETSLPDLPFTNYGKAEPSCTHSTAKSTPPLRTDLNSLTPWTAFPNDIHHAIQSATARAALNSTPFHIAAWTESGSVNNEEDLRAYATYALHEPVQRVLKRLGVNGQFHSPGGGDFEIVGAPDFSWTSHPTQLHPKVVVRVPPTTCLLVVEPRWWRRLNTKLGGWWIWSMLSLLLMAPAVTLSTNNPCTLSNRSTDI